MPFSIIAKVWRKPGLTMEQFIHHYETSHIPLVYELAGSTFPLHHTRHYIQRVKSSDASATTGPGGPSNRETPAILAKGSQDNVDYDVVVEMAFDSEADWTKFLEALTQGENADKVAAEEVAFVDGTKTTFAYQEGETMSSPRK